tara:strand:+ start:64 stop:363 length:300 start_codon:yes stop_codon:yes gene_type:complete
MENSSNTNSIRNNLQVTCPYCNHEIQGTPDGFVGQIRCFECNNVFNFPNLSIEEKNTIILIEINNSINGIKKLLWTVFVFAPAFSALVWFLFILLYPYW